MIRLPASRLVFAFLAALLQWASIIEHAHAQAAHPDEMRREEKLRAEAKEALTTLANLIAARAERAKVLEKLRRDLKATTDSTIKKELEAEIKLESQKLEQVESQMSALTTGIDEAEVKDDNEGEFELQSEL